MREPPLTFLHYAYRPKNTFRTDKIFDGYCSLQLMDGGAVELSYGSTTRILERPWFWVGYPGPHIRFHVAPGYPSRSHRQREPQHLHRHFKRATGTTLHAYTLQYRGTTARELLAETDLPIKAIAVRLGYRDAYFFSRQFRSLTGVSPLAYRRSRQA